MCHDWIEAARERRVRRHPDGSLVRVDHDGSHRLQRCPYCAAALVDDDGRLTDAGRWHRSIASWADDERRVHVVSGHPHGLDLVPELEEVAEVA